jgi:hypothetical protein
MDDIDPDALNATVDAERAAVIATLRGIAERLEQLPRDRLYEALPIVVSAVEDLTRRTTPWLR